MKLPALRGAHANIKQELEQLTTQMHVIVEEED